MLTATARRDGHGDVEGEDGRFEGEDGRRREKECWQMEGGRKDEVDAALLAQTRSQIDRFGCQGEMMAQKVNQAIGSDVPVHWACNRTGDLSGFTFPLWPKDAESRGVNSNLSQPSTFVEGNGEEVSGVTVSTPLNQRAGTGNGQVKPSSLEECDMKTKPMNTTRRDRGDDEGEDGDKEGDVGRRG